MKLMKTTDGLNRQTDFTIQCPTESAVYNYDQGMQVIEIGAMFIEFEQESM